MNSQDKGWLTIGGLVAASLGYVLYDNRVRHTIITWSKPVELDRILYSEKAQGYGLYCITDGVDKNSEIYYIGRATRTFNERLLEHRKKLLNGLDGTFYVRIGEFIQPEEPKNSIINDTESALIYEHNTILNVSQTKGYTYWNRLRILNRGFRGPLKKEIVVK